MNAAGRLGIYGAGLLLTFGAAFAGAGAIVPDSTVAAWAEPAHSAHAAPEESTFPESDESGVTASGLTTAASGFTLGPVTAPAGTSEEGILSFQILDPSADPVTTFETAHDKDLHLIVVRSDGSGYRHVHPELDAATGTWSLPWTWDAAGTYRAYADFTADGTSVTLSRTVDVAGAFTPSPATRLSATDTVDEFDVTIDGDLVAGKSSELIVKITRGGVPVSDLEPYLGAFGHLVALRGGDLAYLHVHARGDEPQPGDLAGPSVTFTAEAPSAGRYLLYLDYKVDGDVHTAEFVLDAVASPAMGNETDTDDDGEHDGH